MNGQNPWSMSIVYPAPASHFDRFPCQSDMAVFALTPEVAIVLVVLLMAADTGSRQYHFILDWCFVAINTFEFLVFPVKFEAGFIVVEIPVFPVAGVVTSFTSCPKGTLVHVLLFVTRHAIRLGFLEYHSQMTFLAFCQYMLPGKLEARDPVIEFNFFP